MCHSLMGRKENNKNNNYRFLKQNWDNTYITSVRSEALPPSFRKAFLFTFIFPLLFLFLILLLLSMYVCMCSEKELKL